MKYSTKMLMIFFIITSPFPLYSMSIFTALKNFLYALNFNTESYTEELKETKKSLREIGELDAEILCFYIKKHGLKEVKDKIDRHQFCEAEIVVQGEADSYYSLCKNTPFKIKNSFICDDISCYAALMAYDAIEEQRQKSNNFSCFFTGILDKSNTQVIAANFIPLFYCETSFYDEESLCEKIKELYPDQMLSQEVLKDHSYSKSLSEN